MAKCGNYNPLLMLRTRGMSGAVFQNIGEGRCVSMSGYYWAPGMAGDISKSLPMPALCTDFSQGTLDAGGTAAPTYTFARNSIATVEDFEGHIQECKVNEARFQGARRVENVVQDSVSGSFWNTLGTGSTTVSYHGEEAHITFQPGESGFTVSRCSTGTIPVVADDFYTCRIEVYLERKLVNQEKITVYPLNLRNSERYLDKDTPEGEWIILSVRGDASTAVFRYTLTVSGASTELETPFTVRVRRIFGMNTTADPDNTAPDYVSNPGDHGCGADGVKYFPYENGNTVDANGVVTEARGAPISGIAYLNEASATNYFLNSDAPVTQTISGLTGAHVFWLHGNGSMTLSGGATGVVTEDSAVTADPAGANVTLTIAGDVTRAQCELAPGPSSYIPTSGAAVTRDGDKLSYSNVTVNNDFVAACDYTPLYDAAPVKDGRLFGTSGEDTDDECRTYDASHTYAGYAGGGCVFGVVSAGLVKDTRMKYVFQTENDGGGAKAQTYLDGVGVMIDQASANPVGPHTSNNIWQVGHWEMNLQSFPCLYHSFHLFDQPLTDTQLQWVSKPGNQGTCSLPIPS